MAKRVHNKEQLSVNLDPEVLMKLREWYKIRSVHDGHISFNRFVEMVIDNWLKDHYKENEGIAREYAKMLARGTIGAE